MGGPDFRRDPGYSTPSSPSAPAAWPSRRRSPAHPTSPRILFLPRIPSPPPCPPMLALESVLLKRISVGWAAPLCAAGSRCERGERLGLGGARAVTRWVATARLGGQRCPRLQDSNGGGPRRSCQHPPPPPARQG